MTRIQGATIGLFVAWCLHDLEELLTESSSSRALFPTIPNWVPIPDYARTDGLTQGYVRTGIATVGAVIAAAALLGYRTGGRSAFYQNTLLAFGLHGFGHGAMSLAAREYTSGILTGPTVAVPFWIWASRALNRAGVPNRRRVPIALAIFAASLLGGHLVAYLATGNQS